MRLIGIFSAVIAVLGLMAISSSTASQAATFSGTVEGQRAGKEPERLSGVAVTVFQLSTEENIASTKTNELGKFTLEIPSGIYDIHFDPGLQSVFEATTIREVAVKTARTLDVVLAQAKLVHLTGTMRDAAGNPIAHVPMELVSKFSPPNQSETAADGSYSYTVSPGTYELFTNYNKPLPGLPEHWAVQTGPFSLAGDEVRNIELPPTSTVTVEAIGKEGAPISGSTVRIPELIGKADVGGYSATTLLRTSEIAGVTGEDGRAAITVFDGNSCFCSSTSVSPPPASGYGDTAFKLDSVSGDTTVAVNLANSTEGHEEQDPQPPQLQDLTLKPSSIDTSSSSQTVTLTAHVTDDLSGFIAGSVSFVSPNGKQSIQSGEFERVSGTALDGVYEIPVIFKQASEAGAWEISAIHLSDQAGNERLLESVQIKELGLPHTVSVTTPEQHLLTVSRKGTGSDGVTSSPAGISCGVTCSASFDHGTVVTLKEVVKSGTTFLGWSGCDSEAEGKCIVTMSEAKEVTAEFEEEPTNPRLRVFKAGVGSGTVTSSPAGISCGETCFAEFEEGTEVTLSAEADKGSVFSGWSGACSGTGACKVTLSEAKEVTATFTLLPRDNVLTLTKSGTGAGTVKSKPAAINCGSTCNKAEAALYKGALVKLSATPATGSTFTEWTGCDAVVAGECEVTMDEAKSVTAAFSGSTATIFNPQALTLTKAGSGSGSVTGSGIACSGFCTSTVAIYPGPPKAKVVTLTAKPAPGSELSWSGCDVEPEPLKCKVTMSKAREVTATFEE